MKKFEINKVGIDKCPVSTACYHYDCRSCNWKTVIILEQGDLDPYTEIERLKEKQWNFPKNMCLVEKER